jgi:hypothetical protein
MPFVGASLTGGDATKEIPKTVKMFLGMMNMVGQGGGLPRTSGPSPGKSDPESRARCWEGGVLPVTSGPEMIMHRYNK